MNDRTDNTRPNPVDNLADHGVTFEQTMGVGNDVRALCLCGWASPWSTGRKQAREAGVEHLTLTADQLRTDLVELLASPGVQAAIDGFTPRQLADVRRAAAVALGERFVREHRIGAEPTR